MKQTKKKPTAPSRVAAITTAAILMLAAVGAGVLYFTTAYLPLLLGAIVLLLPAVINLLLLIPLGRAVPPAAPVTETEELPQKGRLKRAVKQLPHRILTGMKALWHQHRGGILVTLTLLLIIGANVYFWLMARTTVRAYALGYHIPVFLVAAFVLFIVLEKWCKHAGDSDRQNLSEERAEHEEKNAADVYHQAILHSLRGALTAGRLAQGVIAVVMMIKLMGFADLCKVATVIMAVLFAYETLFLVISLAVRVIRHEMNTAPELSIPMPGLGGEDLGVLSYLEKNTGITMRSLWSIRLIKTILPYTLMGVVLLLWGFSGMVKIEPYQQGAHYRLGRLQDEALQPGLHMTLPWPFDTVEVYDTQVVSNVTVGYLSDESTDNIWTESHGSEEYKLLLGGGKELVSINLRVSYRIDDLHAYLKNTAAPELLLQAAAYETVTARTISTDLATLLATDRAVFAEEFKTELIARMNEHQTGLAVVSVVLESIHPPVDVAAVYQELISAEIQAQQIVLDAEGVAAVKLADAQSAALTMVGAANVKRLESIATATGAVAEFMASVEADQAYRDEYRYYKYLQAITAAYANGRVVIVGDGIDASNIYIGSITGSN